MIKPFDQDKAHISDTAANPEYRQKRSFHIHRTTVFPDVFRITFEFLDNDPADILKCTGSRVGIARLLR
jgi:hypothetical protein